MKIIGLLLTIALIALSFMIMQNLKTPKELGVTNGKLAPLPSTPNAVSSQTEDKERYVEPWPITTNTTITKAKLLKLLSAIETITIQTETENYIHAISVSGKMRYRDDLEFFIDESENVVHFRSGSRVGYSDMGLNRERYNTLRKKYNEM
ncbi:DUF1499 domain-containing protein [Desulfosediminicola flagellatus]|uniref:DUF1499 domain-containing protein n=1 Tax=Desulfosediminicola flagellatus TaxID=2569541 RepID=UPI0010AC9C49|nr:DUF1499 domain-containing protein [Desulfosediminicola flagellatus]